MPTQWVFDLDNTLYPATTGLLDQGNRGILRFLEQWYAVDTDAARDIQRELCAEHGTTMRGLMLTQGVDPHHFLTFEEALDYSVLQPDPALAAALARLPGRRLVMTNGSRAHAERALQLLGLTALFDGAWGVDSGDFTPKPWPESYDQCFAALAVDPEGAVFVDDLERNLVAPKSLGMTTVHVTTDARPARAPAGHVDHVTRDLAGWLTSFVGDERRVTIRA